MDAAAHVVDVTPRRAQQFRLPPGSIANWQNRRVSDDVQIQSGTAIADAFGLITASNVAVDTAGNRVRFEWVVPPSFLEADPLAMPGSCRVAWTSQPGRIYVLDASADFLSWTPLQTFTATLDSVVFDDPALPAPGRRFYRAKTVNAP